MRRKKKKKKKQTNTEGFQNKKKQLLTDDVNKEMELTFDMTNGRKTFKNSFQVCFV